MITPKLQSLKADEIVAYNQFKNCVAIRKRNAERVVTACTHADQNVTYLEENRAPIQDLITKTRQMESIIDKLGEDHQDTCLATKGGWFKSKKEVPVVEAHREIVQLLENPVVTSVLEKNEFLGYKMQSKGESEAVSKVDASLEKNGSNLNIYAIMATGAAAVMATGAAAIAFSPRLISALTTAKETLLEKYNTMSLDSIDSTYALKVAGVGALALGAGVVAYQLLRSKSADEEQSVMNEFLLPTA